MLSAGIYQSLPSTWLSLNGAPVYRVGSLSGACGTLVLRKLPFDSSIVNPYYQGSPCPQYNVVFHVYILVL